MKKLRTVSHFTEYMDHESLFAWRLKEIADIKIAAIKDAEVTS